MKSTLLCSLLAVLAAILVFSASPAPRAQGAATTPVPVVIAPSVVRYKVIDLGKIVLPASGTEAAILERLLNEHAAQGWHVVATTGTLVILKR